MVGTPRPPSPRPSQLGHGVYLQRCSCRWPRNISLGFGPRPRGSQRDFTLSIMFLYSALKEKELKQSAQNAGDCHFCAAGAQLCALCSVYFSERKSEAARTALPASP